ncbi:MAG: hypothetical protein H2056_07310 [Sphingopyxis sp.]|nr:hypothetical protein [Sphingopyxis sp.]
MNRLIVQLAGAAVLASSVVVAIAPAEARHRRHWHHRDRVDAGDVIAGIFLIGAIAAIADSAGKSRDRDRDRDRRDDDYRYEPQPRDEDYRSAPQRGDRQWVPGNNGAETRAVDACSWAAEGELGEDARVGQIDEVAAGDRGWRVTGTVAAPGTMPRDFTCTYRGGRVVEVTFN